MHRTKSPSPTRKTSSPLEARLASRIVSIRAEKQISQAELARRCDISAAYLSRIESHRAAVTLANLERIAEALEVAASSLLGEEEHNPPLEFCPRGQGAARVMKGAAGHVFEILAPGRKGKLMEPLIERVKTTPARNRMAMHSGEEFNYLLEGRGTFYYGKDSFAMATGDAVYYDATIPHAIQGSRGETSRLLVVVTSRDYLFHGDITKLLRGKLE